LNTSTDPIEKSILFNETRIGLVACQEDLPVARGEPNSSHFTIQVDECQHKMVITHSVRSSKSISVLKNDPIILSMLKKSHTLLQAHFWQEDEVLLNDLGFPLKCVPTKRSKAYIIQDIFESTEAATSAK
jgi:hypothetical protein